MSGAARLFFYRNQNLPALSRILDDNFDMFFVLYSWFYLIRSKLRIGADPPECEAFGGQF
jgi:hypothetical protein